MVQIVVDHVWLGVGLWVLVYIIDHQLTITSVRLYREGANAHVGFEGSLELTPLFQADVEAQRRVSPRALVIMAAIVVYLLVVWWLAVSWTGVPELYVAVLGAFVLLNITAIMRHVRNLAIFWYSRKGEGVTGRIEQARWLSLRLSSIEMVSFALFYLVLFLVTGSWFLAGGIISCGITGWKHWNLSGKARRSGGPVA